MITWFDSFILKTANRNDLSILTSLKAAMTSSVGWIPASIFGVWLLKNFILFYLLLFNKI